MKLYSLAKKTKANLSLHTIYKYLLLGATLFILSGFFYSQGIMAKVIDYRKELISPQQQLLNYQNKQTNQKKQPETKTNNTNINNRTIITPKIPLAKIGEQLSIPTKNSNEEKENTALKNEIANILIGTPMENMIEPISQQDKIVAAFLVGIALKESQFGKHSPKLHGQDCYNYWGYRGIRKRMGTGGHTCFDSPEDAVKTVGERISRLVKSGVDTPQEMVLWKCGSDCNATGGWTAARKWISDVNTYYSKMLKLTNETTDEDEKESLLNNSTEPSA